MKEVVHAKSTICIADNNLGSTTAWQQGESKYGIQRIERVPFEAIVDPRLLKVNSLFDTGEGIEERFVALDMEPHPSASLQPCSYSKYLDSRIGIGTTFSIGKNFINVDDFVADMNQRSLSFVTGDYSDTYPIYILSETETTQQRRKLTLSGFSVANPPNFQKNVVTVADSGISTLTTEEFINRVIAALESYPGFKNDYTVSRFQNKSFTVIKRQPNEGGTLVKANHLLPYFSQPSGSGWTTTALKSTTNRTTQTLFPKQTRDDDDNITSILGQPVSSSQLTSSYSLTSIKAAGETTYINAASNFYAESMNFFCKMVIQQ